MITRAIPIIAVLLTALFLAACGDDDSSTTTPATAATTEEVTGTTTEDSADASGGTELVTADSEYGPILFDSDERAIYLFDLETSDQSECFDECADAWPPVLTDGDPIAGDGIDQSLVGTTDRGDGTTQVTYNGHPLYYFVNDPPGEALCHNVDEFGGLWLVVQPDGMAVS